MVELWKPVKEFDIWSLNVSEAKDIAHLWIDAYWKDREVCQYEKVGDDLKHWCLDNLDRCFLRDGKLMERAQEKGLEIIGAFYDLAMLIIKHDRCATDEQRVEEVKKATEDIARIWAYLVGFDETWDPAEKTHVKDREFWHELSDYMHKATKEMQDAMTKWHQEHAPRHQEMPSPTAWTWAMPKHHHRFGIDESELRPEPSFTNFHLF